MSYIPSESATVRIEDFYRDGGDSLIPRRPGLYVWTIDVAIWLGADKPTIDDLLDVALAAVGPTYETTVGPYVRLTLQDARKPVKSHRRIRLKERLSAQDDFGEWIAQVATSVQRPLYIGKADNLYTRIKRDHLGGKTPLLKNVRERGLRLTDLAVTWWAAPVQSSDFEDAEDETDEADDLAPVDALDESEASKPALAAVDALDGDKSPVASAKSEMSARLEAVESLLIRMAMPMLNARQD